MVGYLLPASLCFHMISFIPTANAFAGHGPALPIKMTHNPRGGIASLVMAKKSFDKKYDNSFDDFRTSGSMPRIPSISEQYQNAQSFVQQRGIPFAEEKFGERLTSEKEVLVKERDTGLEAYEELKKELLDDTAFIGVLFLFLSCIWFPEKQSLSYFLGERQILNRANIR